MCCLFRAHICFLFNPVSRSCGTASLHLHKQFILLKYVTAPPSSLVISLCVCVSMRVGLCGWLYTLGNGFYRYSLQLPKHFSVRDHWAQILFSPCFFPPNLFKIFVIIYFSFLLLGKTGFFPFLLSIHLLNFFSILHSAAICCL